MLDEITEAMRMQFAEKLRDAAVLLDELTTDGSFRVGDVLHVIGSDLAEAKAAAQHIHDIAMHLAGSRVLEVYGPEEVLDPYPQAAPAQIIPHHDCEALDQEAI